MRILSMVKADANSEGGCAPDPRHMAAMDELSEESIRRGVLLAQGGLAASSQGMRVTFTHGKPVVTDGPFAETKELIAGYAILRVRDMDQAIAEAKKLPMPCEIEMRPIVEVEDFGPEIQPEIDNEKKFRARKPQPDGRPQFMLLFQAGAESTEPPSLEMIQAMGRYNDSLIAANVLLGAEGLHPSVAGVRMSLPAGTVERGPFPAKHLLTGYWHIQCASIAEAVEWAKRVPSPSGTIEVRPIFIGQDLTHGVVEAAPNQARA